MAGYIVNFLLVIECWFISGTCLVCHDKLENNDFMTNGFTWHVWYLPDDLWLEIYGLLEEKGE